MRLCVIPGDGIGVEVTNAAIAVLQHIAPDIVIDHHAAGWQTFQEQGTALPDTTLAAARNADAVLFGAVGSPVQRVAGYRSPIVALRRELDLYANIRPVRALPGATTPTDLAVVRENTEGLYVGRERLEDNGNTAIAERVITRHGSERIVRHAFELARERARQRILTGSGNDSPARVTIVHKANVLRVSDGLFRTVALDIAATYPDVAHDELLVDVAAMHLARDPARFDVLVTTNMFGDILSDIAVIHGGGLGLASSANLGTRGALFEPVHGAAPDIAGQGIANPLAAFGCLVLMLEWAALRGLQPTEQAPRLQHALTHVLQHGPHTPDLGGAATTSDVTAAIVVALDQTYPAHQ